MKFKTLKENEISKINGTSLQGFIETTFAELKQIFGEPTSFEGDKTNVEWAIEFDDGKVVSIYDYKQPTIPLERYEWHIGGFDKKAVELVKGEF